MLVRWVGGKSLLANQIIGIFPPHKRYIEPFFGGGWVFFKKPIADVNIINDINGDLINLYRVVRDRPQEMARLIHYTPKHEDEFNRLLAIYRSDGWSKMDEIQRALIYYFLIKNSFNGLLSSFSVISTGWMGEGVIETMWQVHEKLIRADILNHDWKDVLDRFADKDTLVYLDPPYAVTIKEKDYYYQYVMNVEQHKDLRDYLVAKKDTFKFVMSYDVHPFVSELYSGIPGIFLYETSEVFQSSINKNSKTVIDSDRSQAFKREFLITTYRIEDVSPLFIGQI